MIVLCDPISALIITGYTPLHDGGDLFRTIDGVVEIKRGVNKSTNNRGNREMCVFY